MTPLAGFPRGCAGGVDIPVYALAAYRGTPRTLVLAYKERGRRDLAAPLGEALAVACLRLPEDCRARDGALWLVPAPSRRVASRVRGGPHLLALGRACAAGISRRGRPAVVAPALRLAGGTQDAVGLDKVGRLANLAGRVRVDPAVVPPPGTPVVVLDDVVTTGATAQACVAALDRWDVEVAAVVALTSPRR